MGNGSGIVSGGKSVFVVHGVVLTAKMIEDAAEAIANSNWTWSGSVLPINSANYKLKIKKLYSGNGAPAAHFVEACREFGLISEKECDAGLSYYSTRIHARHLKRMRTRAGGHGYKWKRERSNHIGKR